MVQCLFLFLCGQWGDLMRNKLISESNYKTLNFVKSLCLSKNRVPFYIVLGLLFVILNLFSIPSLFSSGNDLFDANDTTIILIAFTLIGFLILISVLTPYWLKKKSTEMMDEDEAQRSVWDKILSLWIPFCFYIIVQMIVLGFCEKISPYFNMSFIVILFNGIALCGLIFVWITICAVLYFVARSVRWYFIGFLALNFAPIIISQGCYEIYNVSSLVPHKTWNPLNFNLFIISAATLFKFTTPFLLVSGIIGIFLYLWHQKKNLKTLGLMTFSIIYKILVIFLISLSAAFLLSSLFIGKAQISFNYILCFLVVALSVSMVFGYFTFRRNKPISRIIITSLAVITSCVLILGAIPSSVQKETYILPDIEDIESVELFLDSIEEFEVDKHFDDCVYLHKILLELFEKGHLPDETEHPYEAPKCIADLWENANFNYKLKDGKSFYREYRDLKDSAFDEFYIRLMKSDMYAYSLKKTKLDNPQMHYYYGDPDGKWCELPESCVEELLNTYCGELKEADKSAFYEGYETIRLTGVYDFRDRIIYIPLSFTDTRNLAITYINQYAAQY